MTPEIFTILGMTATILLAIWTMSRALRNEIKDARLELGTEIKDVRLELGTEIKELRDIQYSLNERMAGLEGLVIGLKEAIVVRSVA